MKSSMRCAVILSMAMAATAGAQGNGKTAAPPDTITFHTRIVVLGSTPGASAITANFEDPIPAAHRLVVQHVSLKFGANSINSIAGAFCSIGGTGFGTGTNGFFQQFIPLTIAKDRADIASFSAGQALTLNLKGPSPITLTCSPGGGIPADLSAELEGLLITAP